MVEKALSGLIGGDASCPKSRCPTSLLNKPLPVILMYVTIWQDRFGIGRRRRRYSPLFARRRKFVLVRRAIILCNVSDRYLSLESLTYNVRCNPYAFGFLVVMESRRNVL